MVILYDGAGPIFFNPDLSRCDHLLIVLELSNFPFFRHILSYFWSAQLSPSAGARLEVAIARSFPNLHLIHVRGIPQIP